MRSPGFRNRQPTRRVTVFARARICGVVSEKAMSRTSRLTSVDALRGFVMVIMALDHTREFFHAGAMLFQAEDLSKTTAVLFLTRWVTHICAPSFIFLAGLAAWMRLER